MITWEEACNKANYVECAEPPPVSYSWYAYRDGQATRFESEEEAILHSKMFEKVADPITEEAAEKFKQEQESLAMAAATIWFDSMLLEYNELRPDLFKLCYEQAYNNAYMHGYDAIAENMDGVIDFANRVSGLLNESSR